jgi:DNA transformation protein
VAGSVWRKFTMAKKGEFIEYLLEQMQDIGQVNARAMFGGHGIYHDGIMFALIADDVLYLKTDEVNRPEFEARNLPPFLYECKDKVISMSYNEAPGEVLDDPDEMTYWARSAIEASRRAARHTTSQASRRTIKKSSR